MATTTKPKRTDRQAPSAPPAAQALPPDQRPLSERAGWDATRGGWVHGDHGKQALSLVNEAAKKKRR